MAATQPAQIVSGTTTSWIPLTTAGISAVPKCSSAIYSQPGSNPPTYMAFDPWQGIYVFNEVTCLPEEVTQSWTSAQAATLNPKYSLGPLNCPSMYTTATTSSLNALSTQLFCCPAQYTYTSSHCISTLTSGSLIISVTNSLGTWSSSTLTTSGATITGGLIAGYIFADSPQTTSSSTSSIPYSTSWTTTTLSTPTSSPTSSPTSPSSSSALTTGAKIGIGLGTTLGVLLIISICILAFILHRRYSAKNGNGNGNGNGNPYDHYATENKPSGMGYGYTPPPQEMDGGRAGVMRSPVEVDGTPVSAGFIGGRTPVSEVSGGSAGDGVGGKGRSPAWR